MVIFFYLFILKINMNHELLNISLKQGKQFNSYQKNIKKKLSKSNFINKKGKREGFVSAPYQMVQPTNNGTNNNQKNLAELNNLQVRYNDLIQKYTDIRQKIGKSSLETISRVSPKNPYLGKNLLFTDGTIVYVTNQGIAKPYSNNESFNSISGNNGCPKDSININIPWSSDYIKGAIIPTIPTLIVGSNMEVGQSCGFEGDNVYVSTLINNPSSSYIGCYNDRPNSSNVNIVPVMNSSGIVNGFDANGVSSVYLGNNNYGGWAAFDQNPNTFWHSDTTSEHRYNDTTGVYEGSNSVRIANISSRVLGEFLNIKMPGINTSSVQNITATQYSISPRLDNSFFITRSPNSWYMCGYNDIDSTWYQVDRQQNQNFTNGTPKVYNISTPSAYSAYLLLIDKVGNDDQIKNRGSVQVGEWDIFANSNSTNDQRAMIFNSDVLGYTSFDKCQEYAIDNGYQYFGLQDVQTDGTSSCLVSNDIAKTQMYGDATNKITLIPLWSSNTVGANVGYTKLGSRGRLFINDVNDKNIWQSNEKDPLDCSIQYSISELSDAAGNDLAHYTNVTLDYCQSECTDNNKCYGIATNTSNNNECWLKSQFKNIQSKSDRNLYQKISNKSNCKFLLMLQDDGNLCIYQGTYDNIIQPPVWTTNTTRTQLQPNADWQASKNSFGRNYIIGGEILLKDQWISSTNGSIKLIMQSDGNLVVYTSETKLGCRVINNNTYGNEWINAVYQVNAIGNKSSLGKIGYVDSESNLREYPDSMIGFINDYQIYPNTDSVGNDITSLVTSDQNGCQTACNNNVNCSAFAYQINSQTCWLKDKSAYPKGNKQPNNNVVLGVRQLGLQKSNSCSNNTINIDTIQYDNYLKGGAMTMDTECNVPLISQSDQIDFDNVKSQLITLGNDIVSKMENLYNEDNNINEKMNTSDEQFKKDLEKYKSINLKIKKELNLQSNNIEGMQNLNINDINGMLTDSDLRVLQENYSYIMWSILAVGLLTITINTMKK